MSDKSSKRFSESPHESDSSEPVAKRTRLCTNRKKDEQLKPTILDVLNEDCWRLVLDYLSLEDVVRSERVSKQWQNVVYRYLKRVGLYIRMGLKNDNYKALIKKYGSAVVSADCQCESHLRALGKHSPALQELRLLNGKYHNLRHKPVHFPNLRRLYLENVIRFKDAHISKLFGSQMLEDLKISENQMMTGTCFSDLKSSLKTLELSRCIWLDIDHVLSGSHHFSELIRLKLNSNSKYVLENVYKVLQKTPKLEHLGLERYRATNVGGLVEALCSLSRLKHLRLHSNQSVTDAWLEAVGKSCKEIRTVDVSGCKKVTATGLEALCRSAGKTLAALRYSHSDLTERDVARFVALCPNLQVVFQRLSASIAALGRRLPLSAAGSASVEPPVRTVLDHSNLPRNYSGLRPCPVSNPQLLICHCHAKLFFC